MPAEPNLVRVGEQAPGFDLPTSDGRRVRLGDYRGREAVLLVFMRAYG